jgi:hypothetical protein
MKIYGEVLLTSALGGSNQLHAPAAFTSSKEPPMPIG